MRQQQRILQYRRFLKHLSTGQILALVFLLTAIITIVGIGLAPAFLKLASLENDQWSNLGALTSVAALAFALGAGLLALIQVMEQTDSRNLGVYRDIYEKLMSVDEIEARRYIYNMSDLSALNTEEQRAAIERLLREDTQARQYVKQVLNLIDYFGFLVEQDWVTADEVIGWLSPVVVKLWEKIGPILEYELEQRPEEPDYYESAVTLAGRCQAWREKHHPGRERITFDRKRL
jgi:hypothetical protein